MRTRVFCYLWICMMSSMDPCGLRNVISLEMLNWINVESPFTLLRFTVRVFIWWTVQDFRSCHIYLELILFFWHKTIDDVYVELSMPQRCMFIFALKAGLYVEVNTEVSRECNTLTMCKINMEVKRWVQLVYYYLLLLPTL